MRELDVAGRDVVGDDQPGDVVGQVRLGNGGADGDVAANDQTDLHFVVEEVNVAGFDDVVERAADRAGRFAEERQRDGVGVHAGVFDVGGEVGHLRHHPARRGDRGHQGKAVDRDGIGAVGRGVDGGPVGE